MRNLLALLNTAKDDRKQEGEAKTMIQIMALSLGVRKIGEH